MKSKYKKLGIAAVIIGVLVFAGIATGVIPMNIFNPFVPLPSYKGPVYFYGESLATQDTTDIDGAGTIEFWTGNSPYSLLEPALTMGTDTHTTLEYRSGQSVIVVVKSTTANAMDHFSYMLTFPMGPSAAGRLYTLEWSDADENWILTLKGGQEAQPTLKCYTKAGVDVSTTDFDLSDNDYVLQFDLKIAIAANYDAIFSFFDPSEGDGEWDSSYLICTANVSAANAGWTIDGPWQICSDGKSYYFKLDPYIGDMFIRWDEEEQHGVLTIPITIRSADIDTSGSGACLFTFNYKECNDDERAYYQTWETDTLTNLSGAVTAETLTVSD